MIAADRDIFTRLYLGTALADDNHARTSGGAVRELYAEIFRI